MDFKIIRMNEGERKIGLSLKAQADAEERIAPRRIPETGHGSQFRDESGAEAGSMKRGIAKHRSFRRYSNFP